MTYPLARLVSAPEQTATVRYDFNDAEALAPRRVQAETLTFGAPSLDTPVDAVSPMYGDRIISFEHRIKGEEQDALTALAVISRELLRPSNWFLWQLNAFRRPAWWRLYATGPEAVSWDRVYVDTKTGDPAGTPSTWVIPVNLTAENFGYGAQIDLGPYTITQAPSGTNPMRVALPTIHGDAPTALRVELTPADDTPDASSSWLLGCETGTSDMAAVVVGIGTGDGFISESSPVVSNAAYFGGSYRAVTVAPDDAESGNNFTERLLGGVTPRPGAYKVLLRCEADAPFGEAVTYLFAFGQGRGNLGTAYGQTQPLTVGRDGASSASVFQGWVDLGEFTFPFGMSVPAGVAGTMPEQPFFLDIGTAGNGDGAVRIDALLLVPVGGVDVTGGRLLAADFARSIEDHTAVFDGDTRNYWSLDHVGDFADTTPTLMGGWPVADPAAEQNLLLAVATGGGHVGGSAHSTSRPTSLNAEAVLRASYRPRILHADGRP